MSIVFAILAFGLLIAFHEFGHMWVAQRMGMRVDRFSIGFGPVLFSWRRGETEYAISAIPLGGYVKIAGMAGDDEDGLDPADERSYANKATWRRALVLLAGPGANYLLAFLIGVPLLMFANQKPDLASTSLGSVMEGLPARRAGLQIGDVVSAVDGKPVATFAELKAAIDAGARAKPSGAIGVDYARGGLPLHAEIVPDNAGDNGFVIGISPKMIEVPGLPLGTAVVQGAENLYLQSKLTLTQIWKMITRQAKVSLSGPLGIVSYTAEQAEKGLSSFVATLWGLSIAVGFFNLLPIPILDGGRLVFLGYEAVSRRRPSQRVEGVINMAGMALVLLLMLYATYGDILRKFQS